ADRADDDPGDQQAADAKTAEAEHRAGGALAAGHRDVLAVAEVLADQPAAHPHHEVEEVVGGRGVAAVRRLSTGGGRHVLAALHRRRLDPALRCFFPDGTSQGGTARGRIRPTVAPALTLTPTPIAGLTLIEPAVHSDARGFFLESWNRRTFEKAGLAADFVQD